MQAHDICIYIVVYALANIHFLLKDSACTADEATQIYWESLQQKAKSKSERGRAAAGENCQQVE